MAKNEKKTPEMKDVEKKFDQVAGGMYFPDGTRVDYSTGDAATARYLNPRSKFEDKK